MRVMVRQRRGVRVMVRQRGRERKNEMEIGKYTEKRQENRRVKTEINQKRVTCT